MITILTKNRASFLANINGKDYQLQSNDFFVKFVAEEAGSTIKIVKNEITGDSNKLHELHMQKSFDVKNWSDYVVNEEITLSKKNNYVCFRAGDNGNKQFSNIHERNATVEKNSFYHFQMTGSISAHGNIMSLLNKEPKYATMEENPDVVPDTKHGAFTFFGLFYNCTSLLTAPDLPEKNIVSHCYDCMFRGCSNLQEMPALPATIIRVGSYMHMFNGCTALKSTKQINAVQMENTACYSMFNSCTGLEDANILDKCNLKYADTYSLRYMFQQCYNLRKGTNAIIDGKVGHATCNSMYYRNYALSVVPKIHIGKLKNKSGLYAQMFAYCAQISSVPIDYLKNSAAAISSHLSSFNSDEDQFESSTNIKEMYKQMFLNCTSLTAAPFIYECALSTAKYPIPANTTIGQYQEIFRGCTALTSLSTDFSERMLLDSFSGNVKDMLKDVANNGVLYCKNPDAINTIRNQLGVPNGWSIEALPTDFNIP